MHGSVLRNSILIRSNKVYQYTGVYLLQNYTTSFGCLTHPSSVVDQSLTAASVTGHIMCQSNNLSPALRNEQAFRDHGPGRPVHFAAHRQPLCWNSCTLHELFCL